MADTVKYQPEGYKRESQLQAACYQWFHNELHSERKMLFHVDNNSWNSIIGAQKKALGVTPGPSDFVFICGTVVFIEMKLPGEKQSADQIEFMQKVRERGHEYVIIESFAEFKMFIIKKIAKRFKDGERPY